MGHLNGFKARVSRYLWSAVVNLKDTITMQNLERLAKHFKNKYGFQLRLSVLPNRYP
ncbi:hypothetical protein NHP22001_09650 [Helicobacter sp. NHP22-001]|nr:hypothetical protein NHP22001_09650 [Helicobacter sp. NHP22-001]